MTETPGGPHVDPKKADKNKRKPRILARITELSTGFVPGPTPYPKFHGCDWTSFPDISSRSTNSDALVPDSRDTPLTRSVRAVLLVYPCYGLLLVQGHCFYQESAVAQPPQERHTRTIEG